MISNIIPFMIFILFFFVLSFMDTFSIKVNDNIKKQLLFFSLCVLVVFAGCRWSSYEVGYDIAIFDYGTYKNIYNSPLSIFNFLSEYSNHKFLPVTRKRISENNFHDLKSFCGMVYPTDNDLRRMKSPFATRISE